MAALFKALADPTRLRVLVLLAEAERLCIGEEPGEVCVCDLVALLGVPQPTASRHLASLRSAKLVNCRKMGAWCHYRLNPPEGAVGRHLLAAVRVAADEDAALAGDVAVLRKRQAALCGPAGKRPSGGTCG